MHSIRGPRGNYPHTMDLVYVNAISHWRMYTSKIKIKNSSLETAFLKDPAKKKKKKPTLETAVLRLRDSATSSSAQAWPHPLPPPPAPTRNSAPEAEGPPPAASTLHFPTSWLLVAIFCPTESFLCLPPTNPRARLLRLLNLRSCFSPSLLYS